MLSRMDDIKSSISEVLPSLTPDVQEAIGEVLAAIGVETKADLALVEESDLKPCLKPIQIRKLLMSWKPKGKYTTILFFTEK